MKKLLYWWLAAAIAVWLLVLGCNSEKHVTKSSQTTDDTREKEMRDSIRLLLSENSVLKSEVNELRYANILFADDTCPPSVINIDERCNADSVRDILNHQFQNELKIYADGTIEARGKLRAANYLLNNVQKLLVEKNRRIDSFATSLEKEKINVKTVIDYKEVDKEVKFIPWYVWVIIAALAFLWLRKQFF